MRLSGDEEEQQQGVKDSMPALGLFHRRQLLGTGRALMRRFPGLIGHPVDGLAALVLAHRRTLGIGFFLEPIGQAVAAEAREIHQIDVLDVAAGAQMFDQAPEHRRFKFRSGLLVDRHSRYLAGYLAIVRKISTLDGELSQILPYRGANRVSSGGISADLWLKTPLER